MEPEQPTSPTDELPLLNLNDLSEFLSMLKDLGEALNRAMLRNEMQLQPGECRIITPSIQLENIERICSL